MFPMFTSMCLTMQITFLRGQVRNIFQPKVKTDTFYSLDRSLSVDAEERSGFTSRRS